IRDLSAERVGQEMRRIVAAPGAADVATIMQDAGILPVVFGGIGYVAAIRQLQAFEARFGAGAQGPMRLAALGCRIVEDVDRLVAKLRLSNAERDRIETAIANAPLLARNFDLRAARRLLYALGETGYRDSVAIAFTQAPAAESEARWGEF